MASPPSPMRTSIELIVETPQRTRRLMMERSSRRGAQTIFKEHHEQFFLVGKTHGLLRSRAGPAGAGVLRRRGCRRGTGSAGTRAANSGLSSPAHLRLPSRPDDDLLERLLLPLRGRSTRL